jgi:protein phosphatase
VDVADTITIEEATRWWEQLTARGGEGMVVKPMDFIARGRRGLTQPAVKCRGPEYLRIIYGPEYLVPENLERLRSRSTSAKRSLALREFALGIEAFERFVRNEPLRRVHECVFGVLALESEPVDPRLLEPYRPGHGTMCSDLHRLPCGLHMEIRKIASTK